MKYFKVKPSKDNVRIFKTVNGIRYPVMWLVGNELYTKTEIKKKFGFMSEELLSCYFEIVDIKKSHTYWAFGARFGMIDVEGE